MTVFFIYLFLPISEIVTHTTTIINDYYISCMELFINFVPLKVNEK